LLQNTGVLPGSEAWFKNSVQTYISDPWSIKQLEKFFSPQEWRSIEPYCSRQQSLLEFLVRGLKIDVELSDEDGLLPLQIVLPELFKKSLNSTRSQLARALVLFLSMYEPQPIKGKNSWQQPMFAEMFSSLGVKNTAAIRSTDGFVKELAAMNHRSELRKDLDSIRMLFFLNLSLSQCPYPILDSMLELFPGELAMPFCRKSISNLIWKV
jgi:hypothetical protein